jgi:DNA-binding CsgD family transcriptional regulator
MARELLDPLIHELRGAGAVGPLPFALYVSALADTQLGRLLSSRAAAVEAVELATGTGDALARMASLGCLALVEARLGDEQACRAHVAESLRLRDPGLRPGLGDEASDALGLLELSLGRPDRAIPPLERANRDVTGEQPVIARSSSFDLIEAYARTGRPLRPAMLAQLHRLSELDGSASMAALAWRGRGLFADAQDFDECFNHALKLHRSAATTFDTARTLLCYGERLRRAGRRRDARNHLESAFESFRLIGAQLWTARAAAELATVGQPAQAASSAGPQSPARHPLTAQERKVARLAAGGATNREIAATLFLSVKTVEMHLGRLYRKLGVRSRTQLANVYRGDEVA